MTFEPHVEPGPPPGSVEVRWHYQWMVLHEFPPATVGAATAADV